MTMPLPDDHPLAPPPHEQSWVRVAQDLAAGFATKTDEYDRTAELPVENLRALHASGLDQATLPREFGGQSLSYRTVGAVLRVLSAADPSTACVWLMHIGAAEGLVQHSTPDVARYYADELIAGRRFANALSEPTGGNQFLTPQQVAEPVDGGYRLTGAKRFVSGCEIADHFLINALVDGEPTLFGLEPDHTVTFQPQDTLGLRATRSHLITLDHTVLRTDRRCPPAEHPKPNHIAGGLAYLSLGIADTALNTLIDYARTRTLPTTGNPLAAEQHLQFEVADAVLRLEAAALTAHHTAWLADQNSPQFLPSAVRAKPTANRAARDIAQLCLQVGGGSGFVSTSPIQRIFRDAQTGWLMAHSVEFCLNHIGTTTLLPPPPASSD
ncbi:acyl-CoA dehydrogenase family protein [Saccharothrix variisporea]|uniref:Alkylation response protein AidB-like acyl-CoA dehydrogenase n=1 Tax=Saccharothrix variisporea TaxID=543527 RepID=A0A495XRG8_9PSEU|nr:acyl-CoA dehydrogenase family protein [Saccharothrix variisporea]RKT75063.1 alkylation response protein AidB-like acyl-CoA dehydrogenase [Saccharothrix variisporea]